MTNEHAHEVIAIEQTKFFLLDVVPINELPNKHLQNVIELYRKGKLTMINALQNLEEYQKELRAMVVINNALNHVASIYDRKNLLN